VDHLKDVPWPLALALGALALIRPLIRIVGTRLDAAEPPAVAVLVTLGISLVWIAVVGLTRVARPVLTLVCAGLVYAVLSIVLSGVLSPILTGELQGPLAMPIAIVPVLLVNAVWGAVAGLLALALQRVRGNRAGPR
jgi:hypothetical protein